MRKTVSSIGPRPLAVITMLPAPSARRALIAVMASQSPSGRTILSDGAFITEGYAYEQSLSGCDWMPLMIGTSGIQSAQNHDLRLGIGRFWGHDGNMPPGLPFIAIGLILLVVGLAASLIEEAGGK